MHAAELARRWPAVKVEPNVLYTDDGQILTSAGSAAGLDLCLHIVRRDHGTRIANALARRLVIPPHREGGQAQYIEQPLPAAAPSLGPCLDWAREHLELPLTVDDLARQALMSPRTFARRFREMTGTTPLQWLCAERVRRAQDLLENTDDTVDRIAEPAACGRPRCCARTSPGSMASPRTSSAAPSGTARPEARPFREGQLYAARPPSRSASHASRSRAAL